MADSFGLKIGLEGEAEFRQGLREINQSFKVLGSEMTLVTSQFDKQDKSIEAVTARNSVLNKEIDAQKDKISTLEQALANASASFGENDKRTQSWAIQLNNVKAELNNMERELDSNNKALDNAGKELDDAGKSASKFGGEVDDAGKKSDDAGGRFEKLGSIVKKVGAVLAAGVTAVGAAAVSAGKALTDMAVDSASYADDIITMSTVTGMSTESLQAYRYAAELVDVSMETLTGTMTRNVKSMSSAMKDTGATAEAYAKLGVTVKDADGNMRDSEAVYWETIDALGQMTNETERDAVAMQLFGKSARDLNPLIAQGSAGIAALTDEAKSMGAVMSGETLNALGEFDDSIQRLKSSGDAAKNVLGTALLPQLQVLADEGVSLIGDFTRGMNEAGGDWSKISEVIGATVSGAVNMVLEYLPQFVDAGMQIVTSVGGAVVDNLPVIVDAASEIITVFLDAFISALPQIMEGGIALVMSVVEAIIDSLPELIGAAIEMVMAVVNGISDSLPELIPAAVEAVATIVQTLLDNMDMILDAALQLVKGLTQGILDSIPVLVNALPEIIMSLVNFLLGAIPQIIETGIQLITSLVTALPDIIKAIVAVIPLIVDSVIKAVVDSIPLIIDSGIKLLVSLVKALPEIIITIVEAIPLIVNSIVDAVVGNIDLIVDAGVQLFVALIENLPIIVMELVNAVPQIVDSIVKAIGNMVWKLAGVGGDLIRGLWQGISDAGAWLWEKVTGFFGGVVDGIKGFLGIHSPSTVFADIGGNMAAGIGEGFGDAMDNVSRGMENDMPTGYDMSGLVSNESGLVDKVVSTWDAILLMSANYWALIQNNFKTIQVSAESTVRSICEGITATIKEVFAGSGWYEIGDGIIRSVIDGMRGAADDLANEAAQAAANALNAARGAVVPSAVPTATGGVTGSVPQGSQSGTGGTMTQVTINSPKPLSEKETAREFEKVSQKLALAVKS